MVELVNKDVLADNVTSFASLEIDLETPCSTILKNFPFSNHSFIAQSQKANLVHQPIFIFCGNPHTEVKDLHKPYEQNNLVKAISGHPYA